MNPIADEEEVVAGSLFHNRLFQYCLLAVLLLIMGFLYLHHLNEPGPAPVGVTVNATLAKEVKAIPKHSLPLKNGSARVYDSPAKIKLNLPKPVIDNQAEQVLSSNQVKADDHPQTITTTINADTGEAQTFVRRDPLPWLAWDDRGEAGAYAGIKNGAPAIRLEARQGIFQVKAVHFGLIGSVDQPMQGPLQPDYFVGVGGWYRW